MKEKDPKHGALLPEPIRSEHPPVRELRWSLHRPDDGDAFVPDPMKNGIGVLTSDDAESFGEEFIASATTGQSVGEDARDEVSDDEVGGRFVELESEEDDEEAVVTPRVLVPRITRPRLRGAARRAV